MRKSRERKTNDPGMCTPRLVCARRPAKSLETQGLVYTGSARMCQGNLETLWLAAYEGQARQEKSSLSRKCL